MKYYTKEITRALEIIIIGTFIILTLILVKYKPAYKVTLNGTELGYIGSKEKLELKIDKYIKNTKGNVAFKEKTQTPEYEIALINRNINFENEKIIGAIENSIVTTYKTYAITVDGATQTIVDSEQAAKTIVDELKTNLNEEIALNVGIIEQYTTDLNVQSVETASEILNAIKIAKVDEYNIAKEAERKAAEEEMKKKVISTKTVASVGTIAGTTLATPVRGTITSRYGSRSSIRSSAHTGLDIATSKGTSIKPIAGGTVTYAGYKGSYGNLVVINHGNGIESYYAHCNTICCTKGEVVDQNTVISTVGSTGNSTGPHLHLEIRKDGVPLNPEEYLY